MNNLNPEIEAYIMEQCKVKGIVKWFSWMDLNKRKQWLTLQKSTQSASNCAT